MSNKKKHGLEDYIKEVLDMFDNMVKASKLSESTISVRLFKDFDIRSRLVNRNITVAKLVSMKEIILEESKKNAK